MGKESIKTIKGIIFFIFILSSSLCFSQQKHNIKGKIKATDESVIKKYNIIILQSENPSDGTQEYEFHEENFSFDINKIPSSVLISATGYKDTIVYINSPHDDLSILMRKSEINLSEVVVKGILPVFHNRKDRMEVQVSNTTLSETGTAMDILQKSPKIKVDENYGVFLGLDEATIYINGRQIPSNKALEMMSSRDIEKIDLITNPSVKYDSNSNVIIDIITKNGNPNTKKSLDIDLTGRMTKGEYWRQYAQAEVKATYSKLYLYSSFTFAPEKKLYNEFYTRNTFMEKYEVFMVNDINTLYDADRNNRAMIGAIYDITNEHSVGLEGNIQQQKGKKNADQTNKIYETAESEEFLFNIPSSNNFDYDRINRTGNLYHLFKNNSGYYQKTIVDIYQYKNDSKQILSNSNNPESEIIGNKNYAKNNLFALRTDMAVPIGKKIKLEAGAKYQYRRNTSEIQEYSPINESIYRYDDKSGALYAMGTFTTDKIRLQAGARVEYINNKAEANDFTQDTVRWSFVPNLTFNYKFNDKLNVDVIYTQNIQRPSFEQQNPVRAYIDPLFYKVGNPLLEDERRHNFSLKANYNDKSIAFNYIRRNDAITWIMKRDPANAAVTRSTFENLKKAEMFSVDAVLPYRSDPFNVFVSTGIIHSRINADASEMSMKQTLWYATVNMDFNLPYKIKLNTNHRYFTKGLMQVFYFKPSYRADVSLKRTFLNDKLSAVFIWNDIFKTDKMKTYTDMDNHPVTYNYSYDQSTVSLSLSYNFNF